MASTSSTAPVTRNTAASASQTRQRETGRPKSTSIEPRSISAAGTRVQNTTAYVHTSASTAGCTHAIATIASGTIMSPTSVPSSA